MTNFSIIQYLELLYLLVAKELKIRYKRSLLGYIWAVANPLAYSLVYWIAFKFVMRVQIENYTVFILTGIFPWTWLSQAVTQGTGSFINNGSLLRKVKFPTLILLLSCVVHEMIHFVISIPIVMAFVIASAQDSHFGIFFLQLPIMLLLQILFIFPLTIIGAVLNVYLRDIQYLVGIFFSMLFFATPMVYSVDIIPETFRIYFKLNPVYWLIESWRTVFHGYFLPISNIILLLCWISIFSLVATWVHSRFYRRIAEYI